MSQGSGCWIWRAKARRGVSVPSYLFYHTPPSNPFHRQALTHSIAMGASSYAVLILGTGLNTVDVIEFSDSDDGDDRESNARRANRTRTVGTVQPFVVLSRGLFAGSIRGAKSLPRNEGWWLSCMVGLNWIMMLRRSPTFHLPRHPCRHPCRTPAAIPAARHVQPWMSGPTWTLTTRLTSSRSTRSTTLTTWPTRASPWMRWVDGGSGRVPWGG